MEILTYQPIPQTVLVDPPTSKSGGTKPNHVLTVYSPLIVSFNPIPTSLYTDLGKLAKSLSKRAA